MESKLEQSENDRSSLQASVEPGESIAGSQIEGKDQSETIK